MKDGDCPTPMELTTYIYRTYREKRRDKQMENHIANCRTCNEVWFQLSGIPNPPSPECLLAAWHTAEQTLHGESQVSADEVAAHCRSCPTCKLALRIFASQQQGGESE